MTLLSMNDLISLAILCFIKTIQNLCHQPSSNTQYGHWTTYFKKFIFQQTKR